MVFYRKYRPQTINDLDSESVRKSLGAVLNPAKQDSVPHAFLFTGPKGLGKTSTARIIAKVVNCVNRKDGSIEPCNTCEQCVAITDGTSLDILEIDAASNRGIDEIRDLKEKIRFTPVTAKKKIYIIDEVHMLTTEAFNALLKTLEEPPEHAMFMLATTEPHKVPTTILSRCFHIMFQLATPEELVRSFKRITKGEKIEIADDALLIVAQLSEGGFRDGAKLLEELITASDGTKITKEFIEERFQVSSTKQLVLNMLTAFAQKDAKTSLEIVEKLVKQGTDIKYFLQQLIEALHTMLLSQVGIETKTTIDIKLTNDEIKQLFILLTQATSEMKFAVLPQLPLELAVLEWCADNVIARNEMTKQSQKSSEKQDHHVFDRKAQTESASLVMTDKKGETKAVDDEEVTVHSMRKQIGTMKRKEILYGPEKKVVIDGEEITLSAATIELLKTSGSEVTPEWLAHFWDCLLVEMKKYNHTTAGVLRGCKIKSYKDNVLVLQANYAFHKERLEDLKNFDALSKLSKLLTGKDVEIKIELKR